MFFSMNNSHFYRALYFEHLQILFKRTKLYWKREMLFRQAWMPWALQDKMYHLLLPSNNLPQQTMLTIQKQTSARLKKATMQHKFKQPRHAAAMGTRSHRVIRVLPMTALSSKFRVSLWLSLTCLHKKSSYRKVFY